MKASVAPTVLAKRFSGRPQAIECTARIARVADSDAVSSANRAKAATPMLPPPDSRAECATEFRADSLMPRFWAASVVEPASWLLL